ncbi:hypothetical protein KDW_61900 [Dictyobacter vulcani]|uniref:DUF111 family protein n=1 Tax=Dictyobacter vulcani TaxID=2607529 RepID=A0A5J4KQQ2_9CHLR|nr:nickel insertion protein [Dictyobacter vulcani]GER92028.1 hypothetical protein KDW_61900 [Dictyobacter vulcani]
MAFVDCSMGCSGPMWLAALLDLGVSLEVIKRALAAVGVDSYQLESGRVAPYSITGMHLTLKSHELETFRSLGSGRRSCR